MCYDIACIIFVPLSCIERINTTNKSDDVETKRGNKCHIYILNEVEHIIWTHMSLWVSGCYLRSYLSCQWGLSWVGSNPLVLYHLPSSLFRRLITLVFQTSKAEKPQLKHACPLGIQHLIIALNFFYLVFVRWHA